MLRQTMDFISGVVEAGGLASASELPSDDELQFAEPREIRASYIVQIALQLDQWIAEPVWEDGSGPQLSGGISGWRERRAGKKAGQELAQRITLDDFVDAAGYLARAEVIIFMALYESYRQQKYLLELCDGRADELTTTPLEVSKEPYRPGQGNILEDMVAKTLPTSVSLEPLFEETSFHYDLIFLTSEDGTRRLKERTRDFSASAFHVTVSTPYETRLSLPDFDDLSFREQIEPHPDFSLTAFNLQVMEHCYAILLGRHPDSGIILDGPITQNGGLSGFRGFMHSKALRQSANQNMKILAHIVTNS